MVALQSMAKQGSSPQAENRAINTQSNVPSPFAQMQASPSHRAPVT